MSEYSCEVNVNINECNGEFKNEYTKLIVTDNLTNGYYDILAEKTKTDSVYVFNSDDDCVKKEIKSIELKKTLKYNNYNYQ